MPVDTNEQRLERELLRERFALDSLLEFAQILTPNLGVEGIIQTVQRTVMGKGLITRSFSYLAESDTGFRFLNAVGFPDSYFPEFLSFEQMEQWFVKAPELTAFVMPVFDASQKDIIAAIGFGPSLSVDIDIQDEPNYLESLSLVTGLALSNAKLFALEKEQERIARELEIARDIQSSLLPNSLPITRGYTFAAYSKTSEVVGGDYYDVISLSDDRILITIADVVGKGIGAAILMSNVQAGIHSHLRSLRSGAMTIDELAVELNEMITASTTPERYITAVFAELTVSTHTISSVVCGHPRPFFVHQDGSIETLPTNGIPLGIIADHKYSVSNRKIRSGDTLVFYTDGLSEARIKDNGSFGIGGVERLFTGIRITDSVSLQQHIESLTALEISDDISIVIISRE